MTDVDAWMEAEGKTAASVTIEELDAIVVEYRKRREEYEAAKKVSGELHGVYEIAENKLINTLKAAGKKSYKVDGVGSAVIVQKNVIQTPKEIEDKRALWQWIEEKYGIDTLHEMLSIHSQKLTSWYNEEAETNKANPLFAVPGIAAATTVENLRFTRG